MDFLFLYFMKRLANIGILLSSLFGYMEWGKNQHSFLFEIEYELLFAQKNLLETITHPIVLASLSGQLLILYCAVKKDCSRKLNLLGLLLLSLLLLLILLAGILSANIKMIGSTIPFLIFGILLIFAIKKERSKTSLL